MRRELEVRKLTNLVPHTVHDRQVCDTLKLAGDARRDDFIGACVTNARGDAAEDDRRLPDCESDAREAVPTLAASATSALDARPTRLLRLQFRLLRAGVGAVSDGLTLSLLARVGVGVASLTAAHPHVSARRSTS